MNELRRLGRALDEALGPPPPATICEVEQHPDGAEVRAWRGPPARSGSYLLSYRLSHIS